MPIDVIVIGSGAGGLTAAVALANAGKNVVVLEQHDRPGGWTHSFTLQGYRFSPGVHYIGDLDEGGKLRSIYQGLGVARDLTFCKLNPDGYDHIWVGDKKYDFPSGKEKLVEKLISHFPWEAQGIQNYFSTISRMMEGLSHLGSFENLGRSMIDMPFLLRLVRASGEDLINTHINDPILRAVLAGQSGDHGLPPSRVSAFIHAGITHHYLNGGYYPLGGAASLPRAFVRALTRAGGKIRLGARVKSILLEGRKILGVELESGEELLSSVVISNADPGVTLGKLIAREQLPSRLKRKVDSLRYSTSCLSLFFATDMDLRSAGLDSGNNWYYDHADIDRIYSDGLTDALLHHETPPGMFLTVTTLKDPSKMHSGHHTCESFAFVGYDAFEKWVQSKPGKRPAEYEALKEDLAWRMVRGLEKRIPELGKHILFWSLGTPLSNEHYLNATRGNLYGIEKTITQVGPWAFSPRTVFDGLYLCGSSTLSHGVAGATQSGIEVAKAILECRSRDLLTMNDPAPEFYPSDDITKWPIDLQKKILSGSQSKPKGTGIDKQEG